jgi:hypothetical protein
MVVSSLSFGGLLMQAMVRVELHHATEAVYQVLHFSMARAGFSRTLRSSRTGKLSHMPIGTYWTEQSADPYAVLEAAQIAALAVDRRAEIVVSLGNQIVYFQCQDAVERRILNWESELKVSLHERSAPVRKPQFPLLKKRSPSDSHGHGSE